MADPGAADAALRRIKTRAARPFLAVLVFDHAEAAIDAAITTGLREVQQGRGPVVIHVPPFSWPRDASATRPPLVIHAPGRVAGTARSGVAMNPIDVAPSVRGLAGIGPVGFQGTDYSGLATARIA